MNIKIWGLVFMLMMAAWSADAQESGKPTIIRVATPMWDDQTHEDGTGLFFDIIRTVYEPEGIKMKYEIVPWKRADEMVQLNQVDVIPAAYKDDPGGRYPNNPLYVDYTTAVFKKSHFKEWRGLDTLKGKSVVWIRGYDFHVVPKLQPLSLKWSEIDDYPQGWAMLQNDRIDAYIESMIDLERYIRTNKIDMTPYQVEVLVAKNAYLKFSKSDKSKKLIAIYDKKIPELIASGELQTLFKKWNVKFESFDPAND